MRIPSMRSSLSAAKSKYFSSSTASAMSFARASSRRARRSVSAFSPKVKFRSTIPLPKPPPWTFSVAACAACSASLRFSSFLAFTAAAIRFVSAAEGLSMALRAQQPSRGATGKHKIDTKRRNSVKIARSQVPLCFQDAREASGTFRSRKSWQELGPGDEFWRENENRAIKFKFVFFESSPPQGTEVEWGVCGVGVRSPPRRED
mmetsp:Transcript_61077/g.126052  ORF Transcript_61077/g.126052 Transcript_61077/m.126052 type:complete len:204 (+) Transcript_61077:455-1066(+)